MSDVVISPNMSLPVPIVSQDPGPDWANNYNSCLSILDQHNHSSGSGVPITQAGISISAGAVNFDSLSFNSSNAFSLRSVRFAAQGSALALATDIGCLYEAGVDLYYNDGVGNQIRMTQSGSIVGTAGSISGLPSGTASASYSGGTFVWQSATNTAANIDAGSYILRNSTASSKALTLQPPNAMASNYSITLPTVPGSTSIVQLDSSGNLTATLVTDNSTIVIASNTLKVPSGGITSTQIAASAVGTTQLADASVTKVKQAAVGQQISSSCGTFTTNSLTPVDITNLSRTITTTGRPVMIFLASSGPFNSFVQSPGSGESTFIQFVRASTAISRPLVGASSGTISVPPSAFMFLDTPAAGTYTYKAQAFTNGGTATVNECILVVYEL